MSSNSGLSSPNKAATAGSSSANNNKSASLTVINELPEAEAITPTAEGRLSVAVASTSPDEDQATPTAPLPAPPPPMGIFGDARPTLLGPADLLRLQRKHEKALRRANEKANAAAAEAKKRRKLKKQKKIRDERKNSSKNRRHHSDDEEDIGEAVEEDPDEKRRSSRRQLPKASTCKSALVTIYYTTTILSAVSAAALLFVGLQYRVKGALIAGTLLAFSAFGLCTNHCFSQSLGVAKQLTPQDVAAASEERQILERSLSLAPPVPQPQSSGETTVPGERKKSTTPSIGPTDSQQQPQPQPQPQQQQQQQQQRMSVASAVDNLLARRLSTLAVFPDPATRLMMRQQHLHHPQQLHHQRRRSSMLHLARSMSLAAHHADPGWIGHPTAGMEDYTEFV